MYGGVTDSPHKRRRGCNLRSLLASLENRTWSKSKWCFGAWKWEFPFRMRPIFLPILGIQLYIQFVQFLEVLGTSCNSIVLICFHCVHQETLNTGLPLTSATTVGHSQRAQTLNGMLKLHRRQSQEQKPGPVQLVGFELFAFWIRNMIHLKKGWIKWREVGVYCGHCLHKTTTVIWTWQQ